jgi:hypothetical protein
MKYHIKLVKDAVDTVIPKKYSRKELKNIKNKQREDESLYTATLSKIKAIMSLNQ